MPLNLPPGSDTNVTQPRTAPATHQAPRLPRRVRAPGGVRLDLTRRVRGAGCGGGNTSGCASPSLPCPRWKVDSRSEFGRCIAVKEVDGRMEDDSCPGLLCPDTTSRSGCLDGWKDGRTTVDGWKDGRSTVDTSPRKIDTSPRQIDSR